MIKRKITQLVLDALSDTPVVLINGPRQAGKSTLVKALTKNERPGIYITFDEEQMQLLARANPEEFLRGYKEPLILDKVQRVPELFIAIKLLVDQNRTPGEYLLTGSANILLLPQIADSLAGRMEIIPLWPLSQAEINAKQNNFIDSLFSDQLSLSQNVEGDSDLWTKISTTQPACYF